MKQFSVFVALFIGLAVVLAVAASAVEAQDATEDDLTFPERITALEERIAALEERVAALEEGDTGSEQAPAQQTESSEEITVPTDQSSSVLTLGAIEITVIGIGSLDAEHLTAIQENYPTTGVYQQVELTVTNTGPVPIEVSDIAWEDLLLIDGQGRTFSIAQSPSFYLFGYTQTFSADFQPGLPANGFIVFELPPDASGFEMALQGSEQRVPVASLVE